MKENITEEVDDQTAIGESTGCFMEVCLPIRWIKGGNAGGDDTTRIGIWVAEVKYGRIIEMNSRDDRWREEKCCEECKAWEGRHSHGTFSCKLPLLTTMKIKMRSWRARKLVVSKGVFKMLDKVKKDKMKVSDIRKGWVIYNLNCLNFEWIYILNYFIIIIIIISNHNSLLHERATRGAPFLKFPN